MNFLFVCGGTAGHINPALAIAAEMQKSVPDPKILFVGAGKDMEKGLIPRAGYHLVNIRMSGLKRGVAPDDMLYNINTLRNLSTAGVKAAKLIKRFRPDAVIGTGGYICYPVLRKAAQMGVPVFVHESNAVPGLTTKLLSHIADNVFVSFPGLEKAYKKPERVVVTGTPVRGGFETPSPAPEPGERRSKPLVVSFWGSLGAERMNERMAGFIQKNIETGLFDHIHAAGKSGGAAAMIDKLRQSGATGNLPYGIEIREYIDDIQPVMAGADIVICRSGGSTLAEITAIGKPAVLIPSPYVTNNQQIENAKHLQKAGGAVMVEEKDCTGESLFDLVASLLGDSRRLAGMAAAQKKLGSPGAAGRITGVILEKCMESRRLV